MFQNSSEATKTMGNRPIFGTSSPYLEKCDLANRPISGSFINKKQTNLDQNSLVWKKVRTKGDFLGDYFPVEMENEKRAVFLGIVQNRAVLVPKSKALVPLPERPVVPYRPLRNIFTAFQDRALCHTCLILEIVRKIPLSEILNISQAAK